MIYKNDNELVNLHIGEKEINRVLIGERLIWENKKVIDLGWGKTWNISEYYKKYEQLTTKNFLLVTANTVSGSDSIRPRESIQYTLLYDGIIKNYNADNGVLNFYTQYYGGGITSQGNARVVLAPRLQKLVYLGFGNTFNIKDVFPNDYQNLTVDNFAMEIIKHWNTQNDISYSVCCRNGRTGDGSITYSDSGTFAIVKEYDANTGILKFYGRSWGTDSYRVEENWDRVCNAYVYADVKGFVE